jgi:hypothetical protein
VPGCRGQPVTAGALRCARAQHTQHRHGTPTHWQARLLGRRLRFTSGNARTQVPPPHTHTPTHPRTHKSKVRKHYLRGFQLLHGRLAVVTEGEGGVGGPAVWLQPLRIHSSQKETTQRRHVRHHQHLYHKTHTAIERSCTPSPCTPCTHARHARMLARRMGVHCAACYSTERASRTLESVPAGTQRTHCTSHSHTQTRAHPQITTGYLSADSKEGTDTQTKRCEHFWGKIEKLFQGVEHPQLRCLHSS